MNNYILSEELSGKIRKIISEYTGGEIFFGCVFDENENIIDAEPVCFGNENAVLAPYEIAKRYNAIMHNHPGVNLMPSENDLSYASYLSQEGIGFFITDNIASRINVVVPPIFLKKHRKIEAFLIEDSLSPGGYLNKINPEYEFRQGQLRMALMVTDSLNENRISLIEAGTGIGKSLAYLIPAFLWAELNQERIVISTNTINLQNQLITKDIPLVKKILNSDIEPVVVKGRRNYLCKLKIHNLHNELEFNEETEEINSILKWANITKDGIMDELNFIPSGNAWERVSSDGDFCISRNCIFFKNCFFQISRRKASESNILIVNHHILFADVDIRSQGRGLDENILLPPYRKIIFDEAHNIVNSASSFFSLTFSKLSFYKFLKYIKKKGNKGFLPRLMNKIQNSAYGESGDMAEFIADNVMGNFNVLFNSSFDIFEDMDVYLCQIMRRSNGMESNKTNIQIRIKQDEWESDIFQEKIIKNIIKLKIFIGKLEESFDELYMKFQNASADLKSDFEIDIKIIKSYQMKLGSMTEELNGLIDINTDEFIIWFDINRDAEGSLFKLNATPLHIDNILCKNIYEVFDSIIFASATISVNKTFDFFKINSGLSLANEREIVCEMIESPFNFLDNVIFMVPTDIPEPVDPEYNKCLNDFLKKSIVATGGSSFVLFTSYDQLKKSYGEVEPFLRNAGLHSFCQGGMERAKLLEKFINETESTLFATSSFWEGVDAPGKTLRHVVLAKLPFSMPSDPVEEARVEEMEKRGINSFMFYTLPRAVIKFRQGFGRLVRRKDDYGVVAVLDSRVLTKFYGSIFVKSLPDCRLIYGDSDLLIGEIKKHIEKCENRIG